MLFAPINPADLNIIQGSYPTQPALPAVGGSEGLGQVVEVGPDAKKLKVGDFVLPNRQGLGMKRSEV
jgi:trans-2-enoyl-CoA reductase